MSRVLPSTLPPPPRALATGLRLYLLVKGSGQVGWGILAFGSLFGWVFGLATDWAALRFHGEIRTEPAQEYAIGTTRWSVGGDQHRDGHPIYAHRFRFSADDSKAIGSGSVLEGVSYSQDAGYLATAARPGEAPTRLVSVEFPADHAELARIVGMRGAPLSVWAGLVLIVPAVGLLIVLRRIVIGLGTARALARGGECRGRLVSSTTTDTRVNGRVVMKLVFSYTPEDGRERELTVRATDTRELTDEAEERVLFHAGPPERAVVADALPGLELDRDGRLVGTRIAWHRAALLLPTLVIAANLLCLLLVTRR